MSFTLPRKQAIPVTLTAADRPTFDPDRPYRHIPWGVPQQPQQQPVNTELESMSGMDNGFPRPYLDPAEDFPPQQRQMNNPPPQDGWGFVHSSANRWNKRQ